MATDIMTFLRLEIERLYQLSSDEGELRAFRERYVIWREDTDTTSAQWQKAKEEFFKNLRLPPVFPEPPTEH